MPSWPWQGGAEPDVLWHLPVSHLAAQLPGRANSMGRGLAQRGCLFQVMGAPWGACQVFLPPLRMCGRSLARPEDLRVSRTVTALPGWPISLCLCLPILGSLTVLGGAPSHAGALVSSMHPGSGLCLWAPGVWVLRNLCVLTRYDSN